MVGGQPGADPRRPPEETGQDPDWEGWPRSDGLDDAPKKIFEARVAARGRRIDAAIARAQANRDADLAQNAEFQKSLLEVAKGGLERARANAETVQKAAGAIGTIYTGTLGVAFSVTSRPLPTRAILPALFLGTAVAASTAYLAYLSPRGDPATLTLRGTSTGLAGQLERVAFIAGWVRRSVLRRVWLLRSSVVALAIGVVLLPIPFVGLQRSPTTQPSLPPWPTPTSGLDAELQKIRYAAEIDEVSRLRAADAAAPSDTLITLWIGGVGLILVIAGGTARKKE
jgi:hypothetical protein